MVKTKQVKKSSLVPSPGTKKGDSNEERSKICAKVKSPLQLSFPAIIGCSLVALVSFVLAARPHLFSSTTTTSSQRNIQEHPIDKGSNSGPDAIVAEARAIFDCSNIDDFLHEQEVAGMHTICFKDDNTFDVFVGARKETPANKNLTGIISWVVLKEALDEALMLQHRPIQHQPWAVYSSSGELLATEADENVDMTMFSGIVLLMEGGAFVWPGVRIGFQRVLDLSYIPGVSRRGPSRNATIETLSLHPLVLSIHGFLDFEECDYIQDKAAPSMKYSGVSLTDGDIGRPASDFRTSQSTFLPSHNSDVLAGIDDRTASLVRIPQTHQEHVQVLRYGLTEHYDSHHDYFNPELYQKDPVTQATIANGTRNRLATVFWYLSDVSEGGETIFPCFNGAPMPHNFKDCTKGLKVKPQRGKVIVFYSMKADGSLDELSLHGSCPVESKEDIKWAANKWVWSKPMNF